MNIDEALSTPLTNSVDTGHPKYGYVQTKNLIYIDLLLIKRAILEYRDLMTHPYSWSGTIVRIFNVANRPAPQDLLIWPSNALSIEVENLLVYPADDLAPKLIDETLLAFPGLDTLAILIGKAEYDKGIRNEW